MALKKAAIPDIVAVNVTSTTPPSTSVPLAAVITTTSQTGVAPFNLAFDGSQSTGSISSYAWSFGDGGTATGPTVSHTYQSAGTFTAILAVADGNGLTQQSSICDNRHRRSGIAAACHDSAYCRHLGILSLSVMRHSPCNLTAAVRQAQTAHCFLFLGLSVTVQGLKGP